MKPSVYLAGPITGLTYQEGIGWRDYAQAKFAEYEIQAFSPLRAKRYLQGHGTLDSGYLGVHPLSTPAGILARDRNDCTKRDFVLANLTGADRVSIGTVMEIAWADLARIPTCVVMEESGNVHDHAMITGCVGFRTADLDQAIEIVAANLLA